MNESQILAAHVAATRFCDLPSEAVGAAKLSLLDAVGVMFAATGLVDACRPFAQMATAMGGRPDSTLLYGGNRVPAPAAAWANGALAHAVDFEDTHDAAVLHPNAAVIPAALAVAEMRENATGRDLLTAIAVGSDVVCRLGLGLLTNPHERGWYHPPMLGAFGATAAAASLLGLNADQLVNAFSLTLCQSVCTSQFQQDAASDVRAVRDAFAAQAGVISALLTRSGVRGFGKPFEGTAGWYQLYAGGQFEPARVIRALGDTFEGANVSYKAWPCCRGTHPFIEAALRMVCEHSISPGDISTIKLTVTPLTKMLCEPFAQKIRPQTAIDAKFSIPFTVASAMVHREVGLGSFDSRSLGESAVRTLMDRMSYSIDIGSDFKTTLSAVVTVSTGDGREVTETVGQPRGHLGSPMSEEDLLQKFYECSSYHAQPMRGQEVQSLAAMLMDLPNITDLSPVWRSMGRALS